MKMLYIVNKDGEPIDGHQAGEMRAYARFIWNDLSNYAKAPRKWITGTSLTVVDNFRRQMQIRFPELRLCEGGWKVDQIGIDYYSSWRLAKVKKGTFNIEGAGHDDNEVEDEDEDETTIEINSTEQENHPRSPTKSKRKAGIVNAPAPKKRRAHKAPAPKSSAEKTKTPAAKSDTERTGSNTQNLSRPVPTPTFKVGKSSRLRHSPNSPHSCC